ncbi:ABC transporter ATP-binding protein [Bacillaceae bacterium SIJ1]|uniref:ABC transporter ATP-binding protein n=1 Tax=Litoribacterium kuwaitense TaxID=1398745 RepID=UPI0013E9C0DD|nr:ABC transporter ATP-binding protein [Litoribacterium kuwaitense]NGP45432.1 ABC transporter ATP-binding protein [Litoribacterium kuwaitense]
MLLKADFERIYYKENDPIIYDVQFTIEEGQWIGLLGSNGAGKSTTIKRLLSLHDGSQGTLTTKEGLRIGYIPERPIIYHALTFYEHLELCAAAYQLEDWQQEAERLIKLFEMEAAMHRYPTEFSKGMQQKLMIILAKLPTPHLYIVDEPFMGLDPIANDHLLHLLANEVTEGKSVLMCTHLIDIAEKYCERFIILGHKRMLASGTLTDIQTATGLHNGALMDCFRQLHQGGDPNARS